MESILCFYLSMISMISHHFHLKTGTVFLNRKSMKCGQWASSLKSIPMILHFSYQFLCSFSNILTYCSGSETQGLNWTIYSLNFWSLWVSLTSKSTRNLENGQCNWLLGLFELTSRFKYIFIVLLQHIWCFHHFMLGLRHQLFGLLMLILVSSSWKYCLIQSFHKS